MRVSFVLPGFPRHAGGGYRVVYEYANFLVREGHDVRVLHLRPAKPIDAVRPLWRRFIVRLAYGVGRRVRPGWFRLDRRVVVQNAAIQNARLVGGSDVIVATSARTADFVAEAAGGATRGVYFLQGFEDFAADASYVERTWRLPLTKIVVSGWLKEIAERLGEDAIVVPNAIDPETFVPGPRLEARPISVLAMVSDQPVKRTDLVCEVFSLLGDAPTGQLVTFGAGPRPADLPEAVVHVRAPDRRRLAHLYASSRVFLSTSDSEGFGLPVAEALACGCAVVSTDTGGVRSVAGDSALYAPVGDAAALAERCREALSDLAAATVRAGSGAARVRGYGPEAAARAFAAAIFGGRAEAHFR